MTVGLLSFATLPTGHRAQVNFNGFGADYDFPFINVGTGFSAFSPNFPATSSDPFSFINDDGYPTGFPASGTTAWNSFGSVYYVDAESSFTGSVSSAILTVSSAVTGNPIFTGQTITGTGITAQTRIGTQIDSTHWNLSVSSSPTGSITIKGFIPWVCDWVGNPSNVNFGVGSAGYTPSTTFAGTNRTEINLSRNSATDVSFHIASNSGALITVDSVTGTLFNQQVVTGVGIPPFTHLNFNGSGTGGTGTYTLVDFSGFNPVTPSYSLSGTFTAKAIQSGDQTAGSLFMSTISSTASNIRIYRQDQENLLSTQHCAPHFINFYKRYGRLRFLNYVLTNSSILSSWNCRPLTSNFSWVGGSNVFANAYTGATTQANGNDFTATTNVTGNPTTWVQGQMVQFFPPTVPGASNFTATIDNGSGSAGNTLTVSAVQAGALAVGHSLWDLNGNPLGINITALGTGTGGTGTYTVSGSAQLLASEKLTSNINITGMTSTSNTLTITAPNHGLSTADSIFIPFDGIPVGGNFGRYISGNDGVNSLSLPSNTLQFWPITKIDANTFTLTSVQTQSAITAKIDNGSGGTGNTLTVTAQSQAPLVIGSYITGAGVSSGTSIVALGTGTGGTGTYFVSNNQNIASEAMTGNQWLDASGNGYSSGGNILKQIRYRTGTTGGNQLPFKPVTSQFVAPGYIATTNRWSQQQAGGPVTLVYEASLDCLVAGLEHSGQFGIPIEACCYIANECGVDPWVSIPHMATDDYVLQMATTMKATLNSNRKWCCELTNELWNTGAGFFQTYYAKAVATAKWGITHFIEGSSNWYGWRFYNMMQQVNSVYSGADAGKVQRIFAFFHNDIGAGDVVFRTQAPSTGVPAFPILSANEICTAFYLSPWSPTTPQAVDVYNYQQGILTSNSTLINSALNNMDLAFNAPDVSYVGAISDGSGGAGKILTVSAINSGSITPYQTIQAANGNSGIVGNTVIVSQTSGTPGGVGVYQVSTSLLFTAGTTFTFTGDSSVGNSITAMIPAWKAVGNTYSIPLSSYEGGWGSFAGNGGSNPVPTSYLGNPLNIQDQRNLIFAYQASSQFATSYSNYLNTYRSLGATYPSQYCSIQVAPTDGGSYGLTFPNIFGASYPAKATFDQFNDS